MNATDASMLKGKIVLIGHFGSTALREIKNDLEDKFSVPSDTNMIFRSPSMPGALIHANAIDNLLRKEVRFTEVSATWWFKCLGVLFVFAYLYFLVFEEMVEIFSPLYRWIQHKLKPTEL
jgi:CHASE2 domain-containing sensor protein